MLCFLSITESQTITKIKQYTVLYSCYTFVLNKYNAIQKMCSFLHRFGIVFTLVWHRFCIGLGSFFHRKGIVFASVWDRLCIGLGSFLHQFGIVFASVWDRFCIVFGSFFPYIFCQGQKLKKCAWKLNDKKKQNENICFFTLWQIWTPKENIGKKRHKKIPTLKIQSKNPYNVNVVTIVEGSVIRETDCGYKMRLSKSIFVFLPSFQTTLIHINMET